MKNLLLIAAILFPLSCFGQVLEEYQGGRRGYSSVKLILYADSTYKYNEWFHTRSSRSDTGRWQRKQNHVILTSSEKSGWRGPYHQGGKKIKKAYLFRNDKFRQENTILRMYPKKKDKDSFYVQYYTLTKKE